MTKEFDTTINSLTPSQRALIQAIGEGNNVCCLGPGGTGKTYALKAAIQHATQRGLNVVVCAPTGIAALNLNGMTVHSTFGADSGILPIGSQNSNGILEAADIIIIDEISMVRRDLFEHIVRSIDLAQKQSGERKDGITHRAFKQLVVCGDHGQLPPVLSKAESDDYKRMYDSRHAFTSPLWEKENFTYVKLREQMRQMNNTFASKLDRVRMGDVSVLKEFRQNCRMSYKAVTLCTRNTDADSINNYHLSKLHGRHEYYAESFYGILNEEMPVPPRMVLAPGELVMFVNNDKDGLWMNGSLATILACNDDCVEVQMHDGRELVVRPVDWPVYRSEIKEYRPFPGGRTEKMIVRSKAGLYSQYPLRPAWAITVHKSQGQTYEEVNIAPGDFFDSGQLYVALSRCRTEEGLHIAGTLKESDLRVDNDVIRFLKSVDSKSVN